MDDPKKTDKAQSIKEKALNKKGIPSDGAEANPQTQDKRQQHQPRDNA